MMLTKIKPPGDDNFYMRFRMIGNVSTFEVEFTKTLGVEYADEIVYCPWWFVIMNIITVDFGE